MADPSSSGAGSAFKYGQTRSHRYTSYRLNQSATAYTPSANGSSNRQWGLAGGYAVSEIPGCTASSSNVKVVEFSPGIPASVSHVVSLHTPFYTSHYYPEQSQGTSETPPTPPSGGDGMHALALDDLSLSFPPIGGEGHQKLSLQGLDQDDQGYPNPYPIELYHSNATETVSNYDLISAKVSETKQPNTASIDALREFIPRSDPEPFSDYFPRVGNPSPGPAIMIGALQPDPHLNAYLQQDTTYGTEYHPDSQASSASPVDDPVSIEESAPMWPHQVPETAFGLPHPNDLHPHLVPVSVSEMSRSHRISKSLSQTSTPPPCKRIGGRRYGFRLSKAGARNARDIRQCGSCWHCFLMKIKCSPGTPCDACEGIASRHGFRDWPLTCFRKLEELTDLFFPSALIGHLDEAAVLKFVADNIIYTDRDDFEIRLTAGYGESFLIDALTFVPADNSQLTHGLGVAMNEDSTASSRVWHVTPFISLQLVSGLLLNQVQLWLNDILFSKLEGWPAFNCGRNCFSWQRGILQSICRFFTSHVHSMNSEEIVSEEWEGRPKMLRKALEFSILTFVMGHQLLIPEDELSRLASELDIYIPQDTKVSCRLPNKIFKMQLLPMLKRLAKDVLTELHVSLRDSKDAADWGFDFSVMILLLTVVAENQISLDDVVACAIDRGDLGRSREVDARVDIKALETSLTDVLIKLFDKKYKSRGENFNPFQFRHQGVEIDMDEITQQLVRDISSVIDPHPYSFFPWPDLDEMHPDQLYPYNVARMLSKFLKPFFETKEGQDQHRSMVVGKRHKQQPSRP